MNELILVLEENPEIQAVISASLKDSPIFINQELNPDYFLQQVQNLNPDLIFISNSESERNYNTCRKIHEDPTIKNIPIVLLVNAKDEIDEDLLSEIQIKGILRKPFEASMLKEQIGQYISIDENFGAEPIKEKENFAVDMSSIGSDLDEIKQKKQSQSQMNDDEINTIPDSAQKAQDSSHLESVGSNMDSLILEDILIDKKNRKGTKHKEDILNYEHDETTDVTESIMEDELIFSLRSGENSKNEITDTDLTKGGLEKLKMSGLEDKYAESLLFNENKESVQKHRVGLSNIDLENNDFEDPSVIWEHPPDLDQTPREGLTEINLEKNDFHPSFPKHLSSLEETSVPLKQEDKSFTDQISEMDTSLLQTESEESNYVNENFSDDLLLNDFEEKDGDGYGIEESEQIVVDSANDELNKSFIDIPDSDDEINSMVKESIDDQEFVSSETALEELEDLSLQMESLEAEEDELEAEEKEFEKDLEKSRILNEDLTSDYQDDELTEFMVDELGDLIEIDEDYYSDEMKKDYSPTSVISHSLEEDVFDSWDEAEEAFTEFNKDLDFSEDEDWTDTKPKTEKSLDKDYFSFKDGRYSFNEDELKDIVTSSVQNALEKSIASSLVELAVSEIKNNVPGRI